ncbi:hypothetical protein [Clostridium sp. CF012]|nr:hypothetical protein [Clostridium sp. CF012]
MSRPSICSGGLIIYTTVEPCIMCLNTIIIAKIRNIVFALVDS